MVIVAAIDRTGRAANVVREAAAVAEAFDEPVHAVHVLTRSDFVDLGRTRAVEGDAVSMEEVQRVATEIAAEAVEGVEVSSEAVGLVGDPDHRIVGYADEHDARYIVVAPRKRSPVGKAVFGSVAQSILLNTSVPVISTVEQ